MKKSILLLVFASVYLLNFFHAEAQNDAMMQAFYWNVPVDESNKNGFWWDTLSAKAPELKRAGITGLWVPAPSKGNWGIIDMGYGVYDHYDLGNYNQKGSVETRFGSRSELENMLSVMHNTDNGQPWIDVYADIILNHVYSSDENEEVNPAVKEYVFDEAFRHGTQYVPYPTNEIKWVIPNATAGDYFIKIKGYYLNWDGHENERAYDLEIDWTGSGFNGTFSWESEPNNGNGQFNVFPGSGQTKRGLISSTSDIDEYKVTMNSSGDLIIKLTARKNIDGWDWNNQENGYYPFEIWHNGQNLATTTLQARTNTNLTFVNHTGPGEANFQWNYTHFHPVDQNDYLTNWEWNGGNDAIIPNTKGFGNDFNTYNTTVQNRLKNWGYWMADEIGFDGFRLDFVRGFQMEFAADWINNLPLINGSQRFIVGEYWGPDFRIKDWVNGLAAMGADADGFDFPLKTSLTDMCNGNGSSFDMRWLNHAGLVRNTQHALPGTSVVTWLDNHDTGKEHDKWVTKDWKMGYSYILTHEGRPCIFYPHYYGVTLIDNHDAAITVSIPGNLKEDINKLLFVRKTYLGGTLEVLSDIGNPYPFGDAHDVYVARREGNGTKSGAIIVINNHDTQTKGLWVDASPSGWAGWNGTTLTNAFNSSHTTQVYSDGRVWVEAPPRSYAIYVRQGEYVPYTDPSARIDNTFEDLGRNPDIREFNAVLYPNPAGHEAHLKFFLPEQGYVTFSLTDLSGKVVKRLNRNNGRFNQGEHTIDLNLNGIANGMYIYEIQYNDKRVSKKFSISR